MKISAANQTLILANDGPTGRPAGSAGQSSSSALQRVTVVAELPDSTVVTVHADYGSLARGAGGSTANANDRVVSSQTPSAQSGDSDIENLLAASPSTGSAALTAAASSSDAAGTSGTNTTASTSASASTLVQMSSPAYSSLLRDSNNSRDTAGNPHSNNESVALYARTERQTGAARSSSLVDVHA
jgi:hypothetical protein